MDRRSDDPTWNGLVGRVQAAVASSVPAAVPVLLAADGFPPLLEHEGRRTANFPQDGFGRPVHHRLHDDERAAWHLEALRAKGFGALVFPEPQRWWLDHYVSLRVHLDSLYETIWDEPSCRIYDIRARRPEGDDQRLVPFMTVFESHHGRLPSVLDWGTGADLVNRLRDAPVVTAGAVNRLDYIDQSLDLVVVADGTDPYVLAEARRVATSAVAVLGGPVDDPRLRLIWRVEPDVAAPAVTLVVDLGTRYDDPRAHLRAVCDAVTPSLVGEVLVIAEAGSDLAGVDERVQVRTGHAPGLEGLLLAVEKSTADVVVLLGPLALPVEGAIAALVRTLVVDRGSVGVGGCLVDPLGSLVAAGGVLMADGGVVAFGDPGSDPFLPLYRYVRPVAICPAPLLAVRAEALHQRPVLTSLVSLQSQHAGLSLALRQQGGGLSYQPEALVIDLHEEPGLGPVPTSDRELLRGTWPSLLRGAPERRDGLTWHDLAALPCP